MSDRIPKNDVEQAGFGQLPRNWKHKTTSWYLKGRTLAALHDEVREELRELNRLIGRAKAEKSITLKVAHNHYPNARTWIEYREKYFKRLRDLFAAQDKKLQEHRLKLAQMLVKMDEMESALRRGQMVLSKEELKEMNKRTGVLRRNLTIQERKVREQEEKGDEHRDTKESIGETQERPSDVTT